jgi:hypothetical protein
LTRFKQIESLLMEVMLQLEVLLTDKFLKIKDVNLKENVIRVFNKQTCLNCSSCLLDNEQTNKQTVQRTNKQTNEQTNQNEDLFF